MSSKHLTKIACPKCGKENEFTVWDSVNVQIDPDMKKQIMSGDAFLFKCPECGNEAHIFYTMLYHDMNKKLMIYLLPDDKEQIEAAAGFINETNTSGAELGIPKLTEGYSYRIVTSPTELQERICIFDSGYDDRVIEIMKVLYLSSMAEQTPDKKVDDILFDINAKGEGRIVFIGDGAAFSSAPVNKEIYEDVKNTFAEKIKAFPAEYYIYDFVWARELIKKMN